MKTSQSLPRNILNLITDGCLIITFILLASSCRKEKMEAPSPASKAETAQSSERGASFSQPYPLAYETIAINHTESGNNQPVYKLTVNANGTASFEGIKNVMTRGKLSFTVPFAVLRQINAFSLEFLNSVQLRELANEDSGDQSRFQIVYTVFTPSFADPVTYVDYNSGFHQPVMIFRAQVENALGVSQYINKNLLAGIGTAKAEIRY